MVSKQCAGNPPISAVTGPLPQWQLPSIFLLVAVQALLIALFVHPRAAQYDGSLAYVKHLGAAVQYLLYFCTMLFLALISRLPDLRHSLMDAGVSHAWKKYLSIQLACYGLLLLTIGATLPNDLFTLPLPVQRHEILGSTALLASIFATLLSTFLLFAPVSWWRKFATSQKLPIILAAVFTAGIYVITGIFQNTWDDFLSVPTIAVAQFLLEIFHGDVVADPVTKELGIGQFIVLISSTCSGYEGMAMITAFLAWYSLTFRHDLKYPHALLLYPIGLGLMWIFNCIRLALLVGIGYAVSPEIAMQGFHSHAGWIYFLCVSIGMILIARRIPYFSGKSRGPLLHIDSQNVSLLPELTLLSVTLLSFAFSAGFEWLYPIRVVLTAWVLAHFWKRFELGRLAVRAAPILIGVLVYLLWIRMVPPAEEASSQFAAELQSVPALAAVAWLAIRAFGATLIVPLAEELAFRGYLINFLSKKDIVPGIRSFAVAWLPLILSSLAFGALHNAWLAGTLAGLAFGMARYWRGSIWDAVVAHMVTNGLLTIHVLTTRQWSYW